MNCTNINEFSFSNFNTDCTLTIFGKLDLNNLNKTRLVSTYFKKIADSKELYTSHDYDLKMTFSKYNDVRMLIYAAEKLNAAVKNQMSWFDFFSSKIGLTDTKVMDLTCMKEQSDELYAKYSEIKYGEQRSKAFNTIMGLFGGRYYYEALPILDVKCVSSINRSLLTDPIMRGVDSHGENFITFRFESTYLHSARCYQVIYELRNTKYLNWTTYGMEVVISNRDLKDLEKGTEKYNRIANLIKCRIIGEDIIIL